MERITGHRAAAPGLDGFIEQAEVVATWSVEEQRAFGSKLLRRVVPAPVVWLFRNSLGILEHAWPAAHVWVVRFGSGTVGAVVADWLVGESRLLSPEEELALVEKLRGDGLHVSPSGVLSLRKCTFMEQSGGCKNLCLNLCKAGTEDFFANELRLPVRLEPDLDDHSCRILLLQPPVPPEEDPVYLRPCGAEQCDQRFQPLELSAEQGPNTGLSA